ncbi:plasmid replication, integration and excision activator [Nonomuraea sp. M3C6]|uniref:Plasmid replication, integration and excision activator n=1 Tax=Nonomuraea marmarensis TaxID=3351344 RepID=A0ABW7AXW3_9ACTN
MLDFDASMWERPVPQRDKATGELRWSVPVLDGDPLLKAAVESVAVKIISPVEPEISAPPAALRSAPVAFEGRTAMPYLNQQGRMAYSYKVPGMRAARPATLTNAEKGGPKDAE